MPVRRRGPGAGAASPDVDRLLVRAHQALLGGPHACAAGGELERRAAGGVRLRRLAAGMNRRAAGEVRLAAVVVAADGDLQLPAAERLRLHAERALAAALP